MTPQALGLATPAFDDLAQAYDAQFTASALGRTMRALTWRWLEGTLGGCRRVLEIGCGTGEDAVRLAARGTAVVATDPSPSMLRLARDKAQRMGCAERIEFHCLPMERLAELSGERFDGVWSNFGAINCVARLDEAVGALAPLVAPGAPLVWVVMGRHVPWEWAWFLARGRPRKALRRLQRGGAAWRGMRISYPSPGSLARSLRPHFAATRRAPLGCLLPPSYAGGWLESRPAALAALARAERAAQRFELLAALADHYVFEARRAPPCSS